jgi:class 3 adenylate cyclase
MFIADKSLIQHGAMEAPPLERKLVAILAADVAGYSRSMHDDEEAALATLTSHRSIIDGVIEAGRGQISSTAGDSVLAEFASVVDAVRCAVAVQQAMHRANAALAPERQMHLRIGINVGDVMVKDGGIFGDGVNVAARVEALADAAGICVTRGVRDHVRDRVDYEFEDLGEHGVKNIARPVRVFRVVFDAAGRTELSSGPQPETPSLGTTSLSTAGAGAAGSETIELAFWQSVQASDDLHEYEVYLKRFPNGTFADLARARLAKPEAPENGPAPDRDIDLTFWESIKDSDNPAMFEAYIEKFPRGEFKVLAELRLSELMK